MTHISYTDILEHVRFLFQWMSRRHSWGSRRHSRLRHKWPRSLCQDPLLCPRCLAPPSAQWAPHQRSQTTIAFQARRLIVNQVCSRINVYMHNTNLLAYRILHNCNSVNCASRCTHNWTHFTGNPCLLHGRPWWFILSSYMIQTGLEFAFLCYWFRKTPVPIPQIFLKWYTIKSTSPEITVINWLHAWLYLFPSLLHFYSRLSFLICRRGLRQITRGTCPPPPPDDPAVAVPETTSSWRQLHRLHPLARQTTRYFQNREFHTGCQVMGKAEKPSCNELRQIESLHPTVLQEKYNQENRAFETASVPVLPNLTGANCVWSSGTNRHATPKHVNNVLAAVL